MIAIKNLTKIYHSKNKNDVIALDNININLASKGLTFIYGKSGSGKSTLLNILACFDETTTGDVIVDGNNINNITEELKNEYRTSHIGFIFQDYHLIHNLTVKENIELALSLIGEDDEEKISKILEKVGLKGYENRYPKELSGGECQRVAIARCLIKEPKYIFADEPTGNLDSYNSNQILELLKELSKERLVVIISHDVANAYKYGDRIIELDKGKVVKDLEKIEKEDGNIIYIPDYTSLSDEELKEINDKVSTGKYTLSQESKKFKPTVEKYEETKIELKDKRHTSFSTIYKISKTFKRKSFPILLINSIVLTLLLIIILISQMFSKFNAADFVVKQMGEDNELSVVKNYDVQHHLHPLYEEDINLFYDLGYEGKIYKLYNSGIPVNSEENKTSRAYDITIHENFSYDLYEDITIGGGKGVLECDLEYLVSLYGKNGQLEVLAGSLEDKGDCSIIITDFLADCIKHYRDITYEEIVSAEYIEMEYLRYKVKAIIDTDYDVRYKNEIIELEEIIKINDLEVRNERIEALSDNKNYILANKEVNHFLSIGYFIDGDYANKVKSDYTVSGSMYSIILDIYYQDEEINISRVGYIRDEALKPGQIKISKKVYEKIFDDENYEDTKLPIKIEMTEDYRINEFSGYRTFDKTLTIVEIVDVDENCIWFSHKDYYELYDISFICYGLHFENNELATKIIIENDIDYYMRDNYYTAVYNASKLMNILKAVFSIITYLLYTLLIVLLINYGIRIIKRKVYEIGILKALGVKIKHIYFIILAQILMLLFCIATLACIPLIFLDQVVNSILRDCFHEFLRYRVLGQVVFVEAKFVNIAICFLTIFILASICSTILLLFIKKSKPINIIKEKNE